MIERLLSLLYIWCFATLTSCFAQKESISELYAQLDRAIEQSQHYTKLKESSIAQLKELIHQENNPKLLINTYRKICSEYKSYQSDSAVAYIQKAIVLAQKEGLPAEVAGLKSQLALQYSTAGAFAEALEVLNHIDKKTLDESNRKDYFIAYYHVYGELGFSNMHVDTGLSQNFFSRQNAYRDTLFAILPHHSEDYLMRKEVMLTSQNKWDEALKVNDERLNLCKEGSHEYGIVAYYRYLIYRSLKNEEMKKYWLLKSAICDVKCAINDQASLWMLADILSQEGDVERSYKYINFSWNANKSFSTRIRSWQISPVLGTIDHNYQAQLKKANQRLVFAIICVSLLVLSLGVLAFYVNKQKKYVTIARNELKKTNEQLEELNKKLSATNEMLKTSNDKLNESNGVKEEYIGQFLGACSHYIDKLDKLRLHVNKMVKNCEYQELYSMTRSSELKEHELGELYANFDKVFLHLFPDFVEDLASKVASILKNRRRLNQYYMDRSLALVRGEVASESASSEQIVGSDSSYEHLEPTGTSEEKKDDTVLNKQGQTFENVAEAVLNPQDQAFVDKATRLVLAHLSDTDFNIDRLCREMAMSRTLFYGRLKTLTGQSPQDFMRLIRLEQAAIFLKQGDSVLDVSVKAGFVNVKYFSTVFKKHFGVSLSKYL